MTRPVAEFVAQIPEQAWTQVEGYPASGEAQIAETILGGRRLIVRRVRSLEPLLVEPPKQLVVTFADQAHVG